MGDIIVNVKFSTESIPRVRIDFYIDTSKTLFFCLFSISLQSILFHSHTKLKFGFYEKFYTITQNIGSVLDKIENRRKTSIFYEKFHLNISLLNSKMKKKINDTACIKSILCTLWHLYFDFWHNCIIKYLSAHVRKIFSNRESFHPRFARAKNLSRALQKILRTCIEIYYLNIVTDV